MGTFTNSELEVLQAALPNLGIKNEKEDGGNCTSSNKQSSNKIDIVKDTWPPLEESSQDASSSLSSTSATSANVVVVSHESSSSPQNVSLPVAPSSSSLDWYGAPKFCREKVRDPRSFRDEVRAGRYVAPTNGVCPGFMQCNLVVLP